MAVVSGEGASSTGCNGGGVLGKGVARGRPGLPISGEGKGRGFPDFVE